MDSKVVGNVVGVPNPRSDWAQNDPTKADYIKNKPTYYKVISYDEIDKPQGDIGSAPVILSYVPMQYSNRPFINNEPCTLIWSQYDYVSVQIAIALTGEMQIRRAPTDALEEYTWENSTYATKNYVEDMCEELRKEHAEHICGDEIDTKYKIGDYIPSIMVYDSADGYENAPFECDGIIITHSCAIADGDYDNLFTYQFAISYDGKIVHRTAFKNYQSDPDKFSDIPWSDNFIPTKLSQLKNDTGFLEPKSLFGEQLFYDEIDTKYYPGDKNIPLVMTYDSRKRDNADEYYENAPFDSGVIFTVCQDMFYYDMIAINYTSYQIATNGHSIKVRWESADNTGTFEGIPWIDVSPTNLSQLKDDIGFKDVKDMYDTLMDGGYDTDTIISAFESAFEACQIANENVGRIESVESSLNANALKGSVSDSIASLCDVSPAKHKVKITTDASVNSVTVKGANLFDGHSASLVSSNNTCSVEAVEEGHIKVTNKVKGSPQYGRVTIPFPISSPTTLYVKFSARVSDTELSNPVIYVGYRNSASSATSNKTTSTGITTEWKEFAVSVSVTSDVINQFDELMLLVYTKHGSASMNNVGVYVEVKDIMISTSDSEYIPYESSTHNVKNGVCEVDSIYPSMSISTDVADAVIKADYNRDINKAFAELQAMILGG